MKGGKKIIKSRQLWFSIYKEFKKWRLKLMVGTGRRLALPHFHKPMWTSVSLPVQVVLYHVSPQLQKEEPWWICLLKIDPRSVPSCNIRKWCFIIWSLIILHPGLEFLLVIFEIGLVRLQTSFTLNSIKIIHTSEFWKREKKKNMKFRQYKHLFYEHHIKHPFVFLPHLYLCIKIFYT